jgi:hypothetical protein
MHLQELENTRKVRELILDWRAGDGPSSLRPKSTTCLGELTSGILNRMGWRKLD